MGERMHFNNTSDRRRGENISILSFPLGNAEKK